MPIICSLNRVFGDDVHTCSFRQVSTETYQSVTGQLLVPDNNLGIIIIIGLDNGDEEEFNADFLSGKCRAGHPTNQELNDFFRRGEKYRGQT